jgi:hypothetical protein
MKKLLDQKGVTPLLQKAIKLLQNPLWSPNTVGEKTSTLAWWIYGIVKVDGGILLTIQIQVPMVSHKPYQEVRW